MVLHDSTVFLKYEGSWRYFLLSGNIFPNGNTESKRPKHCAKRCACAPFPSAYFKCFFLQKRIVLDALAGLPLPDIAKGDDCADHVERNGDDCGACCGHGIPQYLMYAIAMVLGDRGGWVVSKPRMASGAWVHASLSGRPESSHSQNVMRMRYTSAFMVCGPRPILWFFAKPFEQTQKHFPLDLRTFLLDLRSFPKAHLALCAKE
jgi:hypothetical protein